MILDSGCYWLLYYDWKGVGGVLIPWWVIMKGWWVFKKITHQNMIIQLTLLANSSCVFFVSDGHRAHHPPGFLHKYLNDALNTIYLRLYGKGLHYMEYSITNFVYNISFLD